MPPAVEDGRPVVAVDLGATTTRVALIRSFSEMPEVYSSPTPSSGDAPDVVTGHLASLIRSLLARRDGPSPDAIGISACGPIDHRRGAVIRPPNLPFPEIPLVTPLGEEFGLPVRLANDCHAGVIGEATRGAGRDCENLVYVTLSTGIGGGVICNRRLVLGRDGNAAEIGHFPVDTTYSLPCGCGGQGHWEGYASGRFLPRFYARWCEVRGERADEETRTAEGIFTAARRGNPHALRFMEALGEINGRGISSVIVAYDPSRIVLDGSVVTRNEDLVLPNLLPFVDRFLPLPEIRVTTLGGLAPLVGAAIIARGYETPFGPVRPP